VRRIFAFIMTTLDGNYEGPNREFDFWVADEEFDRFSAEQLDEVDTLVFGRVTYEGMAAYWPMRAAAQDNPEVAARMNGLGKIVVSRTLDSADWSGTRIVRDAAELGELKRQPGKDVAILGSCALTESLLRIGLVDELRIMVNPVVIGDGKSLFRTARERIGLRLVKTRRFDSGNVLLHYQAGDSA
jgi:dihydrofolate reductase